MRHLQISRRAASAAPSSTDDTEALAHVGGGEVITSDRVETADRARILREALKSVEIEVTKKKGRNRVPVWGTPYGVKYAPPREPELLERVPWASDLLDTVCKGDLEEGAALFYAYDQGLVSGATVAASIEKACEGREKIVFIVWVKHHWVTTVLEPGRAWTVYDSDRNDRVADTLASWAEDIGLPIPVFPTIPQQRSHSEECGIFAFLMMRKLRSGEPIPVLKALPWKLAPKGRPSLRPLTTKLKIPGAEEAADEGWKILDEYYREWNAVCWTPGGSSASYAAGTHLRVKWYKQDQPDKVFNDRAIITSVVGTKRSTRHLLSFQGRSQLAGVSPKISLPPLADSNIRIVSHEVDENPEAVSEDSESESDSDEEPSQANDEEDEEEHHRFYENFVRTTRVDTYQDPQANTLTGFRPLTVGEFKKARIRPLEEARQSCAPLIWSAMVTQTRQGHIKELQGLKNFVEPLDDNVPLDVAIARYADHARVDRKSRAKGNISWSTVSRIIQTLIGAFAVFPNYATGDNEEFPPIVISHWAGVRDSLKAAKRLTNVQGVREPEAATADQVAEALPRLSPHDQVFLSMAWLTSQRPGDVVHVKVAHVVWSGTKAVIRFSEGKNHAATDQYSIHCEVPDQWSGMWKKQLKEAQTAKRKFLFQVANASQRKSLMRRLREALRATTGGDKLELKSLRRGSLQAMAVKATPEQLLKFSRHQDVKTLRRYLNYDGVADAENQAACEHTRVLARGGGTEEATHPKSVKTRTMKSDTWCVISEEGEFECLRPPKPDVKKDRRHYKYHVKKVSTLLLDNMSKMAAEASDDPKVLIDWMEARRYLEDNTVYQIAKACDPPPKSDIRPELVETLQEAGQIREVSVSVAKNFCIVFVIPEDNKARWRIIKHPREINAALADLLPADSVSRTNATRRDARIDVFDHPGCVEYDFAAYFDQFGLAEAVGKHFVFYDGRKFYEPLRLLMGASFSVDVATAGTRVLVHNIGEGLSTATRHMIDNIRIAGTQEHCAQAGTKFKQRCEYAGVTINEFDPEEEYKVVNDFMGDVVNFLEKTICCREKHKERLAEWAKRVLDPAATYRDWFACYGTASYMAEALGITPAQHLSVRLFMRDLARHLWRSPEMWKDRMPLAPPAGWHSFIGQVLKNKPAKLVEHPVWACNTFIDASDWGLGVLARGPDGSKHHYRRGWTEEERGLWSLKQSTVAEPRAAIEAIRWANKLFPGCTVYCYSDHRPFVDAFWKCGSYSPGYNQAILTLGETAIPVVMHHIPGKEMPADGLSRGLMEKPGPEEWTLVAKWVEKCALHTQRYYRIVGGGKGARTFAVRAAPRFPIRC